MKRLIKSVVGMSMLALAAQSAIAAEQYGNIGVNDHLEAMGSNIRLSHAELSVSKEGGYDTMKIVFFKDTGNKQLGSHWVPNDPRGATGTTDVLYATDTVDGIANCGGSCTIDSVTTTAAIDAGMASWDAIDCTSLPIVNIGAFPFDLGLVQEILGFGGLDGTLVGGITHAGWLPLEFFEAFAGADGEFILGVTFTFIWVDDDTGVPTDINSDGKDDTALREIYMNNHFEWEIGNSMGTGWYDIEAVMNHEQGHALSQGHFGSITLNPAGKVIWTPKNGDNVMLAAIGSNQLFEGFHGTDKGGHCSIWANWPLK